MKTLLLVLCVSLLFVNSQLTEQPHKSLSVSCIYYFAQTDRQEAELDSIIRSGNKSDLKQLIANKEKLNLPDSFGWTPLMYACNHQRSDLVEEMLESGADPNVQSVHGISSLIITLRRQDIGIAKLLLKHGADINQKLSCKNGQIRDGWSLMNTYLLSGRYTGFGLTCGDTVLMEAARNNQTKLVQFLLEHGANPNIKNAKGETPLMITCCDTNLLALLLDAKANIDEIDDQGYTSLMRAADEGQEDTVRFLLDKKAAINIVANDGNTAISLSLEKRHTTITSLLTSYRDKK